MWRLGRFMLASIALDLLNANLKYKPEKLWRTRSERHSFSGGLRLSGVIMLRSKAV